MASIKLVYGSSTETCWSDTSKITTPSLILNDGGTLRYTPLFGGNAGAQVVSGSYKYTLGHLIVGDKRVSIARANNTWTNTVVVDFYTSTSSVHTPGTSGTHMTCSGVQSYSTAAYTTYYRKFYIKISSQSMAVGSIGGFDVNYSGCYHTASTSWVEAYSDSSKSGYPSATATIYIKMNGSVLSKSVNFSTSSQSTTFSQSGTY